MARTLRVQFQMTDRDDQIRREAPVFVSTRAPRAVFAQLGVVVAAALGQRERTTRERIREQQSSKESLEGGRGGTGKMAEPESNYAPDRNRDDAGPSDAPDSGTGSGGDAGGGYDQGGGWWAM